MSQTGNATFILICTHLGVTCDLSETHCTRPWSLQCSEQIVVDILGHLSTCNTVFDHLTRLEMLLMFLNSQCPLVAGRW